ncbi:MAG: LPS-assembly protein LptD, partial [Paracoccus sp. (in: a-proteobacteria)]
MTAASFRGLAYATALTGLTLLGALGARAQGLNAENVAPQLEGDWTGGAALAPLSDRLTETPVSDRTPTTSPPATVAPRHDVSIGGDDGTGAAPEDAATLLADTVQLEGDNTLIAAGGVVVWYRGARLVASRIIVDGDSGDLTIEGPIHLTQPGATEPERDSILIADSAQLDRKLQDGIVRGARMLLAHELQIAATEAQRSEGGQVTKLRQVVSSACTVCEGGGPPLWEIRARSVTHDARTRLIHLEYPRLRLFGLPVFALPMTISAPDPTVERQSGFLRPEYRT